MRALEGDNHTLSHLPLALHNLKMALAEPANNAGDTQALAALRRRARECVERRTSDLLEPTRPAMLAAMLDPRYSSRLSSIGIDNDTMTEVHRCLTRWIADLPSSTEASDAASPNDDNNAGDTSWLLHAEAVSPIATLQSLLRDYLAQTATSSHRNEYPMPTDIADAVKTDTAAALRRCFGGRFAPLKCARAIFSMPASSASAERAFSASGRICTPLRNRLSPDNVEYISVMQQYFLRNDFQSFCDKIIEHLDNE